MKPKEITLDVNEKNDRQPQENGRQPQDNEKQPQENEKQPQENKRQPQENERQHRDRLKRQLLEEAKNKQLEKKMKKTARRKARNKKLPSIATSAGQTSTRPVYTTVSSGCCMGKTVHTTASSGCCVGKMVPSLQKEESMVSSDAFDHHKPLHLVNVDIFTNIDVNKSEDGITVVPKHQDGMMLESAKITPNEGQDLLKTHVSSTSAVPQHQQPVSACGHSCSMYCNILGDEDAVSPFNFDSAEYCETNQPFGQNTDQTTLHNEDDPILEGIDSDQPSMPCVSLVPSSSASDLPYIHKEAETEILSCLRKPQFQRHLPLNVGSMQLQRSLNNIILSHLLSQYYPETHTSKEDLKHCHGIVSFSKFLSQNLKQRRLQVMLTKSTFCALMNMHYCQRMFTSWPSRPVLKDISCYIFSSWKRSSLKKCYTTSSSRFKVKVPERVCEALGDKIDVSVCRCNTDNCQSGKVLKEMHTHMQYENDERIPTTTAQFVPCCNSFENTELTNVDEVSQNVEVYSLTAADVNTDPESCRGTHNDTSDEVPQNVEVYSLTAADVNTDPESCQGRHNHTSDEVPKNVEVYSLTAADRHADLESCRGTHNDTSDEVPQNVEVTHSLTAADVNTDPESCQGTHNDTSDEVPQNVEGYSLTATDRHADAESCGGTHNHTSSEGYVQGEHLLNERQVASDLWCPIRQEFVPDNWDDDISLDDVIDSAGVCATTDVSISTPAPTTPNRALFVEACIEIDDNEKQCRKQQFLDVEISKQNSSCCQEVMKDVTSDCDNKPKQTTDTVYDVREVDKRKCCAGNDQVTLSRTTVSLLPHTTVMNMQQQRKAKCLHQEHQLLNKSDLKLHQSTDLESMTEAERNKSNGKVWLRHVVSNQSHPRRIHTAELLMHQLNDIEVEQTTEPCESISYLNKTFGALQNSSDMKKTIDDGVEIHTAELLTHQLNDTEVEQKTEPCESISYLNKIFGALQNSSDMKKTIDDGVEIHTAEVLTHQLNDTEVEQKTEPCESISYLNKIFGALQNSSDMKKTIDDGVEIHTAEVLTHQLNDTEVEQKTEPCESISYLNKIFGALQNSSDMKKTIDDGVEIKRPEFNSSNNPAGSSKNSCADVVNLKEVMVIDHGKYELKYKTDIVENSLPSMGVPDSSATVNSGRDCSYHNIESACELENNVHRKWEFIPDSVLTVGTAEASVNQLITDYKCQQMADEFPRECLTQGNSDSLTYGECYTNKPIYNSALPVNNESTECSFHTNSSTNNSPQQFTTVHPTLFHPSTIQVASNNLCHVPTKSDLSNLLALTLEKEQERLYLLLCDLQAKVLALEHIMKARNITKSPLAAGGDIDSLKRAGSLPSDKELSLEQIDAILDKFVRVANKCFIPAIEHTSNKSIQWNQHVQNVQCGKTEKQADQRDLSDAELDNILKRLHMLGINDIKMPHTRWQSTAHSVNQSSQVGGLNRDRCFWDPQLQSRLLKWPPEGCEQKYWLGEAHTQLQTQVSQNKKTNKTVSSRLNSDRCFRDPQLQSRLPKWPADGCEQKYWLGEANTQLQTRVSQNKKTNKTVSSCQDGANHSIPRHDIPSRNSTDVTWSMQELQGQLQSGNPQKSYEKVGSFTTVNSPCNSAQENRTNIPKNQTPYKLLRRKVIRTPDCSLSEKKNRVTETCPDLAAVALPSETGRSPPNSREPSKSFSLSGSALPVLRKNVEMQKTESSHCSHRLPSQCLRPVLTVSKTLPKKAGEFNSKDDW